MTVLVREQPGAFESTDYAAAAVGILRGVFGGREARRRGLYWGVCDGDVRGAVVVGAFHFVALGCSGDGFGGGGGEGEGEGGKGKGFGRVKCVVDVEEIFCLEGGGTFWGGKGAGY